MYPLKLNMLIMYNVNKTKIDPFFQIHIVHCPYCPRWQGYHSIPNEKSDYCGGCGVPGLWWEASRDSVTKLDVCCPCSRPSVTPVKHILQLRDLASKSLQRSLSMASSFFITLTGKWAQLTANLSLQLRHSTLCHLHSLSTCSTTHHSSVWIWPIWLRSLFFHFHHQILF